MAVVFSAVTTSVHPHKLADRKALADDKELVARQRLALEISDVKWQMGSEQGRRNAFRLLDRAGLLVHEDQLDHSDWNPNAMTMSATIAAGDVLRRFDKIVRLHCPPEYITMLMENDRWQKS